MKPIATSRLSMAISPDAGRRCPVTERMDWRRAPAAQNPWQWQGEIVQIRCKPGAPASARHPVGLASVQRKGMPKILIVDDDPHIRDVLRFALDKAGYRVCEAADGAAA